MRIENTDMNYSGRPAGDATATAPAGGLPSTGSTTPASGQGPDIGAVPVAIPAAPAADAGECVTVASAVPRSSYGPIEAADVAIGQGNE